MSRKRSQARYHAVQAIYQWQMAGADIGTIVNEFLVEYPNKDFEIEYFRDLVTGVPTHLSELDAALDPYLDRPISQVDPIERGILRLGAYELLTHPEVPYRVVINEAVERAKLFGAEQGHRYVNGVLDKVAKDLRPVEVKQRKGS